MKKLVSIVEEQGMSRGKIYLSSSVTDSTKSKFIIEDFQGVLTKGEPSKTFVNVSKFKLSRSKVKKMSFRRIKKYIKNCQKVKEVR